MMDNNVLDTNIENLSAKAKEAASFMKGFASPHRLMILCALLDGEKNVSALIAQTGLAQTSMSQHLARLKAENLVTYRRDHRTLYYMIADDHVRDIIGLLYQRYCRDEA